MKRLVLALSLILLFGFSFAQQNELIILRPADPVSLDAQLETTAPGAWVFSNIIEPLITLNPNMEIEPRLATSWEFIEPTRLRFTLREGITFHDGTPFNAEAVKFTWDRAFQSDPPGRWMSLAGPVSGVEIVDDYTVDIVTSVPYAPLLLTMTMPYTGVVSPTAVERYGDEYGRNPVGTGPFKFVEWRTNDRIVLEANEDYWRGRPSLDRVVFQVVPEEGARMLGLRAGQAHMVLLPTPSELPALEADPNFAVEGAVGVGVFYLGINLAQPPMDDVRVRHALHHAIDIELIVENILEGGGAVPSSVISPPVFGYSDMRLQERYPYDPDRAIELLEEAGYTRGADGIMQRDGQPLRLQMLPSSGRSLKDREIAEVIQEFLRQVGILVELDIFEWATTFTLMRGETLDYHLISFTWFTTTADADYTMYSNYRSDQFPPASWNRWRYSNPRVDELLAQARESLDLEERQQLYAEVQEILAEDLPAIPLYNSIEIAALSADVEGFVAHPIQYILDLYPVSLRGQ